MRKIGMGKNAQKSSGILSGIRLALYNTEIKFKKLKVDREKQLVVLDELLEDISVDELQETLPGHQPRYVIYTYKMIHDDQRISYPMCFIFYTPRDSQIELQMMYACTKSALQREVDLTRVYEIRELDELTEEWLREKLK
ncbi:glia maturation factor beta isoform X1 [Anastrepha ludens]|uniref:glia maturation factor beta isoform X1 n=1 Tax=Anastrepha ludens TaxID=28586 RepID=UPI0023AEE738|nr:glia maturation factor beta isoform X1 [Anastrepha ludens]